MNDTGIQTSLLSEELPPQYELLSKVSTGGMGAIYQARNRYTLAPLAIKVLRTDLQDDRAEERFMLEARIASSLRQANICQVHDFGITNSGIQYLVMDWIAGISLSQKVKRDGPLATTEAIPIFLQIAAALACAHANNYVHRDIKPENIMLTFAGGGRTHVHVVDFGVAKSLDESTLLDAHGLTQTGILVGTPLYMSPEQARGLVLDRRADIYSFGCLMYFALVSKPPFHAKSIVDTIHQHMYEAPPEPDPALKIPPAMRSIIIRCLEKDPNDRYASMEEISADLKKLSKGVEIEKHVSTVDKKRQGKRLAVAASFVVGFIIMYFISLALQTLLGDRPHASSPASSSVPAATK